MGEESTRDIAVAADTKIDHHMIDCSEFRRALLATHTDMREDMGEIRETVTKLQIRLALLLGGLTVLGKVWDTVLPHLHP